MPVMSYKVLRGLSGRDKLVVACTERHFRLACFVGYENFKYRALLLNLLLSVDCGEIDSRRKVVGNIIETAVDCWLTLALS